MGRWRGLELEREEDVVEGETNLGEGTSLAFFFLSDKMVRFDADIGEEEVGTMYRVGWR